MFTNSPRRRRWAFTDTRAGSLRSVEAPASLPLPQPDVPEPRALEDDALERSTRLTSAGATDEFTGHTLDAFYDRWLDESVASLAGLAVEQARVDRALIAEMTHRAQRAAAKAERARTRAQRLTAYADQIWAAHFPADPVVDVLPDQVRSEG